MLRGLLNKLATKSINVAGKWQQQQLRCLNIHEYQGAELMGKCGINVPKRVAVSSVEEVRKTIQTTFPNEKELVVKSQILAGGRGLAKFTCGLQGGVHIVKIEQAEEIARKMLGQTLVTKQTGPQGKVVSKVYLCEKVSLVNETYYAITLDRTTAGPIIVIAALSNLDQKDSFSIMAFNDQTFLYSSTMELATKEALDNATEWIGMNFIPGGRANMSIALDQAVDMLSGIKQWVYPSVIPDIRSEGPLIIFGQHRGGFPDTLKVQGLLANMSTFSIDLKVQRSKEVPLEKPTPGVVRSYPVLASTWMNMRLLHLWLRYQSLSVL
ncbi:hypothetical protein L2E82_10291 [Cichorium intybus]|uniref:Uncharacterized protein n=1 Tax=Cichorium intybus TaxID=13427 RepID=A0ACB9G9Z7_CICIN|nr:hypothetical protein L2E82_10291 [Cichorium intybus]